MKILFIYNHKELMGFSTKQDKKFMLFGLDKKFGLMKIRLYGIGKTEIRASTYGFNQNINSRMYSSYGGFIRVHYE